MTGQDKPQRGLRMRQLVSVQNEGLGEIVAMLGGDPREYRVKILGTRPARVVTVTRDKISDEGGSL